MPRRLAQTAKSFAYPLLAFGLAAAWLLGRGIDHRYLNLSDAVYSYTGAQLALHGGHALYTDIVAAQPPTMLLGAAAVWHIHPSIEALRSAIAAVESLSAVLTYWVARRAGLTRTLSVLAALVAVSMPATNAYLGLDGELLLTPLLLLVTGLWMSGRTRSAALIAGAGLTIKLTWLLALAGLVFGVWRQRGARAALGVAACAAMSAAALWTLLVITFGWHVHDIIDQLIVAQQGLGLQPLRLLAKLWTLTRLWWPLLIVVIAGLRVVNTPLRIATLTGAAFIAFTMKPGTVLNVVAPVEPLIAVVAMVGVRELLRVIRATHGRQQRLCAALALSALALAGIGLLRDLTFVDPQLARSIPRALRPVHIAHPTVANLDAAAQLTRHIATPSQQVVVDPLVALLAGRTVVDNQPDWFLVHALAMSCRTSPSMRHCDSWNRIRTFAMRAPVVQTTFNVDLFAASFARDLRESHPHIARTVHSFPLLYTIRTRINHISDAQIQLQQYHLR